MIPSEQQTERAALTAGQRLGHFQILGLLGSGGMGEVYRARDLRLHRDVAIKTLPKGFSGDPERLARLEREAQSTSALNHPNIVSVYDVGQQDSTTWIVSELVEGYSLRQLLNKGPLPLRRVLDVAIQIGDGLAAAHAAGLIHRDLKPENIMLSRDGRVKILDFGLAKHRLHASAASVASANVVTNPLVITGTPAYMSPEQIAGRPCDQLSDIFSLGVVVSEMIAGTRPFSGETTISLMNSVLCDEPAELPDTTPPAVSRLLRHCLEKEPLQRLQSAADFSFALRLHTQEPQPTQPPPLRPNRSIVWLALAGGVVLVSAGTFWLGRHTAPAPFFSNTTLRRLTWDSGLTTDGTISPDGKLVAYASDRGNQSHLDIYVQQIDRGGIVRITSDPTDHYEPTFSPDGSQLAFRSEKGTGGIYEASVLGGEARLVVPYGERPRFSPDGRYLMFSRGVGAVSSALFVQSLAGGPAVEVSPGCTWVNWAAVWSPDSSHILFAGTCQGHTGFWLTSVNGNAPVEVKGSAAFWAGRDLTSEGTLMAVDDWLAHPSRLLVPLRENDASFEASIPVGIDGKPLGPVQRLTFGPVRTFHASASGGGRIVLSSFEQGSNVWKLKLDPAGRATGTPVHVTSGPAETVMPALSRDGKNLAFITRVSGRWALQVTNLESGLQRTVAQESVPLRYPVFGPASDNIVYSRPTQSKKIGIGGGMPETLPFNNVMDWSPEGDLLFEPDDYHSISIAQGPTFKVTPFLSDADSMLFQAHFSSEGKWVTFNSVKNERSRIYVVPFRMGSVPKSEWIPITDGDCWDDKPHFSLDKKLVYFTSDRDGYRCLWAQQLTPEMRPRGEATAVYHFHSSRRALDAASGGGLELGVAPGLLVFNQGERAGNIWLLESR